MVEQLLEALRSSPGPLTSRELSSRLGGAHRRPPDFEVTKALRELLRQGQVRFTAGRWRALGSQPVRGRTSPSPSWISNISQTSARAIGVDWPLPATVGQGSPKTWAEASVPEMPYPEHTGRWGKFRRLLEYYRQCVRTESGAEASSYFDKAGSQFIYLRQIGLWYPRHGLSWSLSLPVGAHIAQFINNIPSSNDDQAVVLGYPLHLTRISRENEPDTIFVHPVFFFHVICSWSHGVLLVTANEPRPEVNLRWLENTFYNKPDKQRNFLSACGLLTKRPATDEFQGGGAGEASPDLGSMSLILAAFLSRQIREPLHIESIDDAPLTEDAVTGIYNRAVLMIAKRTQYTSALLKELAAIGQAPDGELDQTALRHIFINDALGVSDLNKTGPEGEVCDVEQLNPEQRRAVSLLLASDVTVVTGPPGTGKSQVVSAAAANARLKGQSVLFTSRNHKAIDAVVGRLRSRNGAPLVVRCNSKQDPSLRYAFEHAIRDMLSEPRDNAASERLEKVREELDALLQARGVKGLLAQQIAKTGENLGRLEDRLAHLSRDIPSGMRGVLDRKPNVLSANALEKLTSSVQALLLGSSDHRAWRGMRELGACLAVLPWYMKARNGLCQVPNAPRLPLFPWPSGLKSLAEDVPLLERAARYSRTRIECEPLELKLKEFPAIGCIAEELAGLTGRIAELSPRALELDITSRRGLPPYSSRQEFDGLQAAISSMRTGLQDGNISAQTMALLHERAPIVLGGHPCWAVTNLSIGSRIPLVAGLFDLAIIDEASQSDIPSAIPVLYRAKRAGVVGDPFQLTHAASLTERKDTLLRGQLGIRSVEDERYSFSQRSLYDLCAGTDGVEPVFLSETFRSADDIAAYSNIVSYGGRLRVATDPSRLNTPRGMKPGLWWTAVAGNVESAGCSGCHSPEEVMRIATLVRGMLLENDFRGSLGVVTPFRAQANRLQDALFEADSALYDALIRAETHVDTAHGFQGDERDVIIFSLCAGPDMPRGSIHFLRESANLFNVAVSRAKAVVHVVGNRDWAKKCDIPHIKALAVERGQLTEDKIRGPWHPHESPYEEMLFKALREAGLEPRPQYKVPGRRLDMALIRQGDPPTLIDIEVDGDCHRNPDGTRKQDDAWRDVQLQGMGWKVMRFWTYQLREDLEGCVRRIVTAWG